MIFRPELVELIQQGKKTQIRRLIKPGESKCRYRPNHAYRVQPGRGERGVETITVTETRCERLDDITLKDAKREGFRNLQEFKRYWRELHGFYDPDQQVWVISFLVGDHVDMDRYLARSSPSQTCQAILPSGKRCKRAFSDDPAPQEICKCGARRPDERMDDRGYTPLAHEGLRGEPPAIPASLQDEYSKDARKGETARHMTPIHGPAERIASDLPDMRANLTELRVTLKQRPDRQLKREVERMERAVELMEKALQRLRERVAEAA